MDDKFRDILERSKEVFMRYGMKSVTMDDISRELKISKKTLYKYVDNKEDLVCRAVEDHLNTDMCHIMEMRNDAENAIDEMLLIIRSVSEMLSRIHPSIHYDIEKYYPRAWEVMQRFKHEGIFNTMRENMERGMDEGLYRSNLKPDIIARMYVSNVDKIWDASIFPSDKYKFKDVYLEYIRYHIRGISTKKGMKYLIERIKQLELDL